MNKSPKDILPGDVIILKVGLGPRVCMAPVEYLDGYYMGYFRILGKPSSDIEIWGLKSEFYELKKVGCMELRRHRNNIVWN